MRHFFEVCYFFMARIFFKTQLFLFHANFWKVFSLIFIFIHLIIYCTKAFSFLICFIFYLPFFVFWEVCICFFVYKNLHLFFFYFRLFSFFFFYLFCFCFLTWVCISFLLPGFFLSWVIFLSFSFCTWAVLFTLKNHFSMYFQG